MAVARLSSSELSDGEGEGQEEVIERYRKLNSSLSVRLDTQNAEVEHWRLECNRHVHQNVTNVYNKHACYMCACYMCIQVEVRNTEVLYITKGKVCQ